MPDEEESWIHCRLDELLLEREVGELPQVASLGGAVSQGASELSVGIDA